jgi:hypothetical protein
MSGRPFLARLAAAGLAAWLSVQPGLGYCAYRPVFLPLERSVALGNVFNGQGLSNSLISFRENPTFPGIVAAASLVAAFAVLWHHRPDLSFSLFATTGLAAFGLMALVPDNKTPRTLRADRRLELLNDDPKRGSHSRDELKELADLTDGDIDVLCAIKRNRQNPIYTLPDLRTKLKEKHWSPEKINKTFDALDDLQKSLALLEKSPSQTLAIKPNVLQTPTQTASKPNNQDQPTITVLPLRSSKGQKPRSKEDTLSSNPTQAISRPAFRVGKLAQAVQDAFIHFSLDFETEHPKVIAKVFDDRKGKKPYSFVFRFIKKKKTWTLMISKIVIPYPCYDQALWGLNALFLLVLLDHAWSFPSSFADEVIFELTPHNKRWLINWRGTKFADLKYWKKIGKEFYRGPLLWHWLGYAEAQLADLAANGISLDPKRFVGFKGFLERYAGAHALKTSG